MVNKPPDILCLENLRNSFLADHYGDPYVKRKELVKGALLLGTGMIKGALLTTLYNNLANQRALRAEGKETNLQ